MNDAISKCVNCVRKTAFGYLLEPSHCFAVSILKKYLFIIFAVLEVELRALYL
jgi:hypothetical protein